MSDSEVYEEITVTSDGVTVVKRFEKDEFPVPAIAFEVESDRDEAVTITMSDTVPDGIEVEDLGFHPEYGREFWTIEDETITFEYELDAGESYTTVYGIRATGSDDIQQFLTEPSIEAVEPPLPTEDATDSDDIVPETNEAVVKDAITGNGDIPGLETGDDEDEDVATLELTDPNDAGTATADGDSVGDNRTVSVEAGSLTAALATEIREQNVSGEDLKLLRRALDAAEENDGSARAKIDQLQTDIADLRAYTSALEEFLDENGTGAELLEEFDAELSSFDERLDSMQSDLDSNSATLADLTDELDTVSPELERLDSSVDDLETAVEDLEERITDEDVTERIDELESDLSDIQDWQEQIKQTFGG